MTVAVGLSRSLSATITTLTPHVQRQADTIVIMVPQIYEEDPVHPSTFLCTNIVALASIVLSKRGSRRPACLHGSIQPTRIS